MREGVEVDGAIPLESLKHRPGLGEQRLGLRHVELRARADLVAAPYHAQRTFPRLDRAPRQRHPLLVAAFKQIAGRNLRHEVRGDGAPSLLGGEVPPTRGLAQVPQPSPEVHLPTGAQLGADLPDVDPRPAHLRQIGERTPAAARADAVQLRIERSSIDPPGGARLRHPR